MTAFLSATDADPCAERKPAGKPFWLASRKGSMALRRIADISLSDQLQNGNSDFATTHSAVDVRNVRPNDGGRVRYRD